MSSHCEKECQATVRKNRHFKLIMLMDHPTIEVMVEEPLEEEEGDVDVDVKVLTRLPLNASTFIKWVTFNGNVQTRQKEKQSLQKLIKKYRGWLMWKIGKLKTLKCGTRTQDAVTI